MGSEREGSVKLDADIHFPRQGSTTNDASDEITTGVVTLTSWDGYNSSAGKLFHNFLGYSVDVGHFQKVIQPSCHTEICSQRSDIVVCGNGRTGEMQDAEFRELQGTSAGVNFMLHLTRRI